MKIIDVYGFGNALVDMVFEVEDQFFTDNDLKKGFMTLADHQQQQKILDVLKEKYGLIKRAGGGSAANTMYALSQFGATGYYSCKVANDEPGDFFMEQLGQFRIETNLSVARESGTTGRCLIMVSPDAERTMLTFLGISESVSSNELDFDALIQSKYLYIEGYLVTSDSARAAVIEAKKIANENDVMTAMTFSDPSMLEFFKDGITEIMGSGVDLLFCNEREAMLWTGEDDLQAACEKLQNDATQFAVTRGEKGALLYDGEKYIDIAPHPVEAIDTNGAGDMFAGAFLFAITHGCDFETAGNLASLASSSLVAVFGPRLEPDRHGELLGEVGIG